MEKIQNNICENWDEWEQNAETLTLQTETKTTEVEETQPPEIEQDFHKTLIKNILTFMKEQKTINNSIYYENGKFVLAKYCKMIIEISDEEKTKNILSNHLAEIKKIKNKQELFKILLIQETNIKFHSTHELQNFLTKMGATVNRSQVKVERKGSQVSRFERTINYKPKKQQKSPNVNYVKGIGYFQQQATVVKNG